MKAHQTFFMDCHLAGRKYYDADLVWDYLRVGQTLRLERDMQNPHDPNAIKVMMNGAHVGYITAQGTARVKEYLESGNIESITGKITGGPVRYTTVSSNGNYYAQERDTNYDARFTMHLTDSVPSAKTVAKASAASGSGCLIPILMGLSFTGIIIALL